MKRGKDDVEDDEDERLLQEFKDEMADISVPADEADEIQETMRKEFDNIINEVTDKIQMKMKTQVHRKLRDSHVHFNSNSA